MKDIKQVFPKKISKKNARKLVAKFVIYNEAIFVYNIMKCNLQKKVVIKHD